MQRIYFCEHEHFKHAANRANILLFYSIIERNVLMALVFSCKDMLEKVTMQRAQQFLFVTERTQLNATHGLFRKRGVRSLKKLKN